LSTSKFSFEAYIATSFYIPYLTSWQSQSGFLLKDDMALKYSPVLEARRIFRLLCEQADNLGLPESISAIKGKVRIESDYDRVYFPIPFKETETAAALKAVEGAVACALAQLKFGEANFVVRVDLERASCFLFQAYLATVDGLGKLDKGVKTKLKGGPDRISLGNFSG
jgi:hypothetical protein